MANLLSQLTNSEQARLLEEMNYMNLEESFREGAVARIVAMDFWTRGEAPTFEEFARSWTKTKAQQHQLLTPEYAYLTDLRHQRADGDWKASRTAKAASALQTLSRIAPAPAYGQGSIHRR